MYCNVIDIVEYKIQNQFTKIFPKQTTLTASIQLLVPPNIEGPEEELISETVSNPVAFMCDATGIPPPTLVWLKNGKPLGNTLSCSFLLFCPPSSLLGYCCAVCSLFSCFFSSVSRQTLMLTDWIFFLCFEILMKKILKKYLLFVASLE